MPFSPIPEILEELKLGKPIVLVDDEDRENEGDIVYAAEKITPQAINFMLVHGRGLICLALTAEWCDRLHLHAQTSTNTAQLGTAFTVTVDAHPKFGVTTGVSAKDQATTIQVAVADDAQPGDLLRPGHMHPLRARDGGVLVRAGQTEGSVDLARLAGLKAAGVICEIIREDGEDAPPGTRNFLPEARPEDVHDRRPDQLSPEARAVRQADRERHAADRVGHISDCTPIRACSIRSRTWPCARAASAS